MTVSPIPVPWRVGHMVWTQGGRDRHGNPVSSWAAPVPLPVHAVAPRISEQNEPDAPNRHAVVDGLILYCPAGTRVGPHDRIEWEGVVYDVDGPVADYTAGPWDNPAAGVVVELKRGEG